MAENRLASQSRTRHPRTPQETAVSGQALPATSEGEEANCARGKGPRHRYRRQRQRRGIVKSDCRALTARPSFDCHHRFRKGSLALVRIVRAIGDASLSLRKYVPPPLLLRVRAQRQGVYGHCVTWRTWLNMPLSIIDIAGPAAC